MVEARLVRNDVEWRTAMSNGLVADFSLSPDASWFDDFYQLFDNAFVLPDEKEDAPGLKTCLALNASQEGARLADRLGPFKEVICLVRRESDLQPVAGANFIAFTLPSAPRTISLNLNYIFVAKPFRGQGVFRNLFQLILDEARAAFAFDGAAPADVLAFLEINDPHRMRPADYQLDTRHTGLDQLDRLRIWARLGARLLDYRYVQPALSAAQAPDESLLYGVHGAPGATLSACLLRDHLQRFFSISVLKGRDGELASRQIEAIARRCESNQHIPLIDIDEAIAAYASSPRDAGRAPGFLNPSTS